MGLGTLCYLSIGLTEAELLKACYITHTYINRCYRKKAFIYGMIMHPGNSLIGEHDCLLLELLNTKLYTSPLPFIEWLYILLQHWFVREGGG